ncbi:MAG: DUF1847 domain-containing protein [Desulfobacterales bacterium]|nr:DUF1847 domain-containing protein [Desulfobacterales bacterium]
MVRDRRLAHNPVAALYTRESYLKTALYGSHRVPGGGALRRRGATTSSPPPHVSVRDEGLRRRRRRAGSRRSWPSPAGPASGTWGSSSAWGSGGRPRTWRPSSGRTASGSPRRAARPGRCPRSTWGSWTSEKVRPGQPEMTCNPAAQAALLRRRRSVELVVLLGQCVGHDSADHGAAAHPGGLPAWRRTGSWPTTPWRRCTA